MEAFLRVVDRKPIMRTYGYMEATLRNGQSRARIGEQYRSDVLYQTARQAIFGQWRLGSRRFDSANRFQVIFSSHVPRRKTLVCVTDEFEEMIPNTGGYKYSVDARTGILGRGCGIPTDARTSRGYPGCMGSSDERYRPT